MTTLAMDKTKEFGGALLRLVEKYQQVRLFTNSLCAPLEVEDMVIQSMPDASPIRWHLAHTTWFFETLVLLKARPAGRPFDPHFQHLFNSYYNAVGEPFPRARRGVLSRPTVAKVMEYRHAVDQQIAELLRDLDTLSGGGSGAEFAALIELGINHEQQHQELMLTDLKHLFSCNPMQPAYRERAASKSRARDLSPMSWVRFNEGIREIGHEGAGFAYDNEAPRHRVLVHAFEMGDRLVANAEYVEFIEDGGYRRPELWLSEGWAAVKENSWCAPLYWERGEGKWRVFTLAGMQPVNSAEPVCHVSFFEADAFARWKGARLPTEAEWEVASQDVPIEGNFVESEQFRPMPLETNETAGARIFSRPGAPPLCGGGLMSAGSEDAQEPEVKNAARIPSRTEQVAAGARILSRTTSSQTLTQMFGDVWEWTASPYVGYPGYRPPEGAVGEYNGKFMCNQYVLRGGSCVTLQSHIRRTYRNFFPPAARWQFTGLRLARDC